MGNSATSSSRAPDHILPPDYLLPCSLGRADVVFAPIGRLGAGNIITSLAYDADNCIIAAGTGSGLVILISDKDLQNTLRLPDGDPVAQLFFLSDNRLFLSSGSTVEIWNWSTGSILFQSRISVSCSAIYQSRFVVFGTDGGRVEVLDVDNARLSAYYIAPALPENRDRLSISESVTDGVQQQLDYPAALKVISLAFDDDDLFIALSNSTIRIYDLKAQKDKSWIISPDTISLLSIEPSNSDYRNPPRIASAGDTGRIILWNYQGSAFECFTPAGSGEGCELIRQMEWITSDTMAVLCGTRSQTMCIYSLTDYSLLLSFQCDMHQFLYIPSTSPIAFVSSSWEGGLFMSELDQAVGERRALIPSDFARCVLFECFSKVSSLGSWLATEESAHRDPLLSKYLQGGVLPETALAHNLLITFSDKRVLSFWDVTSPFSAKLLADLDLISICKETFAQGDVVPDVTCISLCSNSNCRMAIGFSNGASFVIEHNPQQNIAFSVISRLHVHSHPVTLLKLCSNLDRVASADEHSVSLCELHSGQILFASQLQHASCLFFCQIENTLRNPGNPLQSVLLVGTKKRLLFAYDASTGTCLNSEFSPVIDNSPSDVLDDTEGNDSPLSDLVSPSSSNCTVFNDFVFICGMVDSNGCAIPIQSDSTSKSVYMSPRYLVGSWNATLRVCEILSDNAGVRLNSLCEIRYSHRILRCWLISVELQRDDSSMGSAVVTIDSGRRLQIRRLMDINYILLECDIPNDLRSEDIPNCSCTTDGRLSWKTKGGELMTALLFMDALRKVQAPMIAPVYSEESSTKTQSSVGFLSSITRTIKGPSVTELFTKERIVQGKSVTSKAETEMSPFSELGAKARDNLQMVKQTAETSERLSSAAADFAANAKLLARRRKDSWF